MTPQFALAVDPIFLHMLRLLDRISAGQTPSASDERVRINALKFLKGQSAQVGVLWILEGPEH